MKRKLAGCTTAEPAAKCQKIETLFGKICATVQEACPFPMGIVKIIVEMAAAHNPPAEMLPDGTWMVGPAMHCGTYQCDVHLYGEPDLVPFVGFLEVDENNQPMQPLINIGRWEGGNYTSSNELTRFDELPIKRITGKTGYTLSLDRGRIKWSFWFPGWPGIVRPGRKWRFMVCHSQQSVAQESDFNYLFECTINKTS